MHLVGYVVFNFVQYVAGKAAKEKPEKVKKTPAKETKPKAEKKKGPDKDLKPNPKIKVLEKEPFFETK